MFDEQAFIARFESANTEELAGMLVRPTIEEEKALRAHLGDQRYQRMHSMALKRRVSRGLGNPRGNVVVIHGIMGAELSVSSDGGSGDLTWVNAFRIMRGWLSRLRLDAQGRQESDRRYRVAASGILKRYYGELLLSLSENWNVQAFWFDWRKDLETAGDALNTKINEWFGKDVAVHIVAHSMGGLVARTFIKNYPERWRAARGGGTRGRLVMLGTPNHGSFAIPQVLTGLEGLVRKLALLDIRHDPQELLDTLNTFVGSYQMLPSPELLPEVEPLYKAQTYGAFNVSVSQQHLDTARRHHRALKNVVDPEHMIYVAGYDQRTVTNIVDWARLDKLEGYEVTRNGDGRVPHALGLLKDVPTYYVKEDHGALPSNPSVLQSLTDLLAGGETKVMGQEPPSKRGAREVNQDELREEMKNELEKEEQQMRLSLIRMRGRGAGAEPGAGDGPEAGGPVPEKFSSPEQRKIEEAVTRGFLGYRGEGQEAEAAAGADELEIEAAEVEIGLVYGGIEELRYEELRSECRPQAPVDAIAVGHYIGVQPQAAEKALDDSVSAALAGKKREEVDKADRVLTQYTERGLIHGNLGEPFIIPDPRRGRGGAAPDRLIVLVGMGEAGRFGPPELTVLARELCWSLGRLNRLHLATVLIGSGNGSVEIYDAVAAWMNGVRRALTGSSYDEGRRLLRITFVELDPRKVGLIQNALTKEIESQKRRGLNVSFYGLSDQKLRGLEKDALEWDRRDWEKRKTQDMNLELAVPTRVTLGLNATQKAYRFGAISDSASVPEREIRLDPGLVMLANDEMVGEQAPALQLERGRFLEGLLMPDDLRRHLYGRAPLVMMLDAATARIHWEMVAQPQLASAVGPSDGAVEGVEYTDHFLGTARGFTRQLRTTFAPPPEPPPPPRRVLRVLVVADPAADAHLPGAEEEGVAVADLFESYNVVHDAAQLSQTRVQVKRMFGPLEATRTNVLRELMSRQYDILHFAGHCVFQWDGDPDASGWIFSAKGRELLSAHELSRIDRVPKFVFSNACESGITPDRSQERNVNLAPSFAEAFFAQGVSNFVCTAWPVDDAAALQFALTLYGRLLGLEPVGGQLGRYQRRSEGPKPIHVAMREARVKIAETPNGRTTWGAYQHYGNPYFQFFYSKGTEPPKRTGPREEAPAQRRGGRKPAGRAKARAKRQKRVRPAAQK